ncbi:hypothetical protein CDLVIII_0011 [Clostridium sp. DL-VIII]|uniref:hypothetical protein n=1 Tax=Clostridium sp. DL-VIII TaxID=641107 RepID=UPI00023AF5DA|nr:hypothetical protein [Clostridium sp. DL-VIII]EHI96754.1 hypothetical protein CDLVIII_0011 [Clostridium sp. DL-VIII]
MELSEFRRPTNHYDERAKRIDEKICELINHRKEVSDNNPGYPPFEYISDWAEKFDLYEEFLKRIFGSMWNEKIYKPLVKPEGFQKNLLVSKLIEIDNKVFSIASIRQYSNSSVIAFNIDWDNTNNSTRSHLDHTHFEISINEQYDCRVMNWSSTDNHSHYNFVVSPPLPANPSGIQLIFKEYKIPLRDGQIGDDIVFTL